MLPKVGEVGVEELSEALDRASASERLDWMVGRTRSDMVTLYEGAAGRNVEADFFLGDGASPLTWAGKNSLPAFSRFAKAFARHLGRVQGYNVNTGVAAWFGGPGHFLVRPDPDWDGQLVYDYTWEPDAVPTGWPSPVSNLRGTHRLVYGHMKDVVRHLGRNLIVSAAYRGGKPEGAYFMLCRPG